MDINFAQFTLAGNDAEKFLQNQITCNVKKLHQHYQATSICNLKGRVQFGLWIKKSDNQTFQIVISDDCIENFQQHIKKYGAFSKISLSEPGQIFPTIKQDDQQNLIATFSNNTQTNQTDDWQKLSIATGNYWITRTTQELWQPQELRLHQRGGIDYDKGCYLGQEIIARLYFKASPKAWLHRISGKGNAPIAGEKIDKISIVNAINTETGFEALVIAKPDDLNHTEFTELPLPIALQQPVQRH